jgi:hypothetical protein
VNSYQFAAGPCFASCSPTDGRSSNKAEGGEGGQYLWLKEQLPSAPNKCLLKSAGIKSTPSPEGGEKIFLMASRRGSDRKEKKPGNKKGGLYENEK